LSGAPDPPMETVLLLRPTLLTVAIRREILSVLARTDAMTVSTATAHVASIWTARRQRLGESPSAVGTAQALVCQVGADLLDEFAGQQGTDEGSMSDYVTWEVCPRCGLLAALGWAGIGGGAPDRILPVEFDCPTGCRLDPDELVEAYSFAAVPGTPEGGEPRR
jgi:hypothetical protein